MKRDLLAGINAYEMWHQKPVREIVELPLVLPKRLTRLGQGERVVYESDKWEEDGDWYPYQHEFTSRPDVFVADKRGEIDTRDFLDIDDLDDFTVDWAHLGVVVELRVIIPGRDRKTKYVFPDEPLMCCTPELDTVVFLHREPIFVRGGTMRVTERGIVD